jgi:hypothetical protein
MRRAVILLTLTVLLLAVTGITIARENSSDPETEYTVDKASIERSEPATLPSPENSDEPKADKLKPTKGIASEGEAEGVAKREGIGKLAGKGKPSITGDPGGKNNTPHAAGKPEDVGGKPEEKAKDAKGNVTGGRGQQKVTLCHRGKKTIKVGAPAKEAHLNHRDSPGACVK